FVISLVGGPDAVEVEHAGVPVVLAEHAAVGGEPRELLPLSGAQPVGALDAVGPRVAWGSGVDVVADTEEVLEVVDDRSDEGVVVVSEVAHPAAAVAVFDDGVAV